MSDFEKRFALIVEIPRISIVLLRISNLTWAVTNCEHAMETRLIDKNK
jgi:hypothetical protein